MKDQPEKLYPVKFLVEGKSVFPIDMLRYDRAVPATESDSNTIARVTRWNQERVAGEEASLVHVELIRFSAAGKSGPNMARWASFGWKVLQVEYSNGAIEKY